MTDTEKKVGHPAKFSDTVLDTIMRTLVENLGKLACPTAPYRILDPFAGTGRIHELSDVFQFVDTTGVEIEPEWANMHPRTVVGNALSLPFGDGVFDAIVTSPVYGNRMSDHHDAKDGSRRITYRHTLGRPLHPDNAGQLQWGKKYREFHEAAWAEAARVLKPLGLFLVNVSDHVRKGEMQRVSKWHADCIASLGFMNCGWKKIETKRMKFGENRDTRANNEWLVVMRKGCQ